MTPRQLRWPLEQVRDKPAVFWILQIALSAFSISVLCGSHDIGGFVAWSTAALAWSVFQGARGWRPWRSGAIGLYLGHDVTDETPLQAVAERYLASPANRILYLGITATAVLTPWLVYPITLAFQLKPLGYLGGSPIPLLFFAVAGCLDAVRASFIGLRVLAQKTLAEWGNLVAAAGAVAGQEEDESGVSVIAEEQKHRLSRVALSGGALLIVLLAYRCAKVWILHARR